MDASSLPPAARQREKRPWAHRTLEVDVQLDLRNCAQECFETQSASSGPGPRELLASGPLPCFRRRRSKTKGGTSPVISAPNRETSFSSRLET